MAYENREFLKVATVDRRGRIVCPTCQRIVEVPQDRYLTRGIGTCATMGGHKFAITDEVALAANERLSKTREGDWRKDPLKGFVETPKEIAPDIEKTGGGGKIIIT